MEEHYRKVEINGRDNLPKETGAYFVFDKKYGLEADFFNNDKESRDRWMESYYWYLIEYQPLPQPKGNHYLNDFDTITNNHTSSQLKGLSKEEIIEIIKFARKGYLAQSLVSGRVDWRFDIDGFEQCANAFIELTGNTVKDADIDPAMEDTDGCSFGELS